MVLLFERSIVGYFLALGLSILCFMPKELLQRGYARKLSMYSQYKIWIPGLIMAIISPFMGFAFVTPGHVDFSSKYYERYGRKQISISMKQIGIIINAGFWFSMGFGIFSMILGISGLTIFSTIAKMNFYIAFFNMWPLANLDGVKIIRWKPSLWVFYIILSLGFLIGSYFV